MTRAADNTLMSTLGITINSMLVNSVLNAAFKRYGVALGVPYR